MFVPSKPPSRRRCGRCGQLKAPSEFAWRRKGKGQLDNYRRQCRADYKREHYASNRERYIAAASRRKRAAVAERTRFLLELFSQQPCSDCGERDPLVLEFDHVDHKRFEISQGLRDRNWEDVIAEIAKCDVVRGGFARARR